MIGWYLIIPPLTISLLPKAFQKSQSLFIINIYGLKSIEKQMTKEERELRHQKICDGIGVAIAKALDRHRRLGESIAVWQDGKVVILSADQIPIPDEEKIQKT